MDFEEKELVARAKSDPAAFGQLYDQNYARIFNYVLRRTGNVEIAQDITAETFLKALKNIGGFQWRNISFSAWLYKISTNEVAAYFRKGRYKEVSLNYLRDTKGFDPASSCELEEELIAAQEVLERHEEFLACREEISLLHLKYQEVITLRFFAGKQLKEIGKILNKPEGTVKSLLHRGLGKLKRAMLEEPKSATFSHAHHYKEERVD